MHYAVRIRITRIIKITAKTIPIIFKHVFEYTEI